MSETKENVIPETIPVISGEDYRVRGDTEMIVKNRRGCNGAYEIKDMLSGKILLLAQDTSCLGKARTLIDPQRDDKQIFRMSMNGTWKAYFPPDPNPDGKDKTEKAKKDKPKKELAFKASKTCIFRWANKMHVYLNNDDKKSPSFKVKISFWSNSAKIFQGQRLIAQVKRKVVEEKKSGWKGWFQGKKTVVKVMKDSDYALVMAIVVILFELRLQRAEIAIELVLLVVDILTSVQ